MTIEEEISPAYKVFKSEAVTAVKAKEEDASDSATHGIILVIIAVLGLSLLILTGAYCLLKRRK